jgi:hypothetical protein
MKCFFLVGAVPAVLESLVDMVLLLLLLLFGGLGVGVVWFGAGCVDQVVTMCDWKYRKHLVRLEVKHVV